MKTTIAKIKQKYNKKLDNKGHNGAVIVKRVHAGVRIKNHDYGKKYRTQKTNQKQLPLHPWKGRVAGNSPRRKQANKDWSWSRDQSSAVWEKLTMTIVL